MNQKALLFVNGEPPQHYPSSIKEYRYIACTDGAYHNYLQNSSIQPDFIIGDLDSMHHMNICDEIVVIHTPDQNKTDFEKAILFLASKGVTALAIYGASGNASDHFFGNISVAMQYYKQLDLMFYDNFCRFFFAKQETILNNVKNKTLSLIPASTVSGLTITGCQYPLTQATLKLGGLTSLRNKAITDTVTINFQHGDLLVFINL